MTTNPNLADVDDEQTIQVARLSKDLRESAALLTKEQARYLVDLYYTMQEDRIRAAHQVRQADKAGEPAAILTWFGDQTRLMEGDVKKALDVYSRAQTPGAWAQSITGIGPVLAAGLLAHIDIERSPTVGHIWSFAGLNPTSTWSKGEKRPWNARLKTLCWKIGESFVKVQNLESDTYGKVYAERKALEIERNLRGDFADQAAASLASKNYGRDTTARASYELGQLPPARIHLRAERYAVKLFLAHYHAVAYESHFGEPPPKPYIIEHGGHTHYIAPPNWPLT